MQITHNLVLKHVWPSALPFSLICVSSDCLAGHFWFDWRLNWMLIRLCCGFQVVSAGPKSTHQRPGLAVLRWVLGQEVQPAARHLLKDISRTCREFCTAQCPHYGAALTVCFCFCFLFFYKMELLQYIMQTLYLNCVALINFMIVKLCVKNVNNPHLNVLKCKDVCRGAVVFTLRRDCFCSRWTFSTAGSCWCTRGSWF